NESVQITQYDYHTQSSAGSYLDSKDLLASVHYPKEDTGLPDLMDASLMVEYEYNRLGELIKMTDQNGITHEYERDALGRITMDEAGGFSGTDIDDRVQEIGYVYDEFGRLGQVTSYRASSVVENQIEFEYDDLWQLTSMAQSPVGTVSAGSHTGTVEYVYEIHDAASTGDKNYSRLTDLKYPLIPTSGRTIVQPDYGTTGNLDSVISRATGIDFGNLGVDDQFIGLSMPALCSYDSAGSDNLELDRYTDPTAGTQTDGVYPGYDRFGRINRQFWMDTDTNSALPLTDYHYLYDSTSNVIARHDLRGDPDGTNPGSGSAARDEEYSYDGLHRLIQENRGQRDPTDSTATGWSYGDNSRKWGLDMLGNWSTFLTDLDGSGTFVQSESQNRTHNSANEILTVKYVGVTGNKTQTHDDAGNWVMQTLANGNEKHFIYDAWNRLVEVAQGPNGSVDTLTRYTYYGLHQRATSRADADMTSSDADERVHYYYDASWRLLERRIDDDYDGTADGVGGWGQLPLSSDPFGADENQHYIWGSHYIDELCAYLRDTDADGECDDERYLATRDRQYSVIGLVSAADGKTLKERVRYTAYGQARHSYAADITGSTAGEPDGAVDADDLNLVLAQWSNTYPTYNPDADITRDGLVNVDDLNIVLSSATALGDGAISDVGNVVGYDGYIFDEHAGKYCVRFRWYDPAYGRWATREPRAHILAAGAVTATRHNQLQVFRAYLAGSTLYLYVNSNAFGFLDPTGLADVTVPGIGILQSPIEGDRDHAHPKVDVDGEMVEPGQHWHVKDGKKYTKVFPMTGYGMTKNKKMVKLSNRELKRLENAILQSNNKFKLSEEEIKRIRCSRGGAKALALLSVLMLVAAADDASAMNQDAEELQKAVRLFFSNVEQGRYAEAHMFGVEITELLSRMTGNKVVEAKTYEMIVDILNGAYDADSECCEPTDESEADEEESGG
ncbi:MAG: hypothetical protein KDE47_00515, partial [Caldilineaceae bacterium]|nr:hypothetical protein [Caldilineaceae bacterium]